jgi:putative acetyltransferase
VADFAIREEEPSDHARVDEIQKAAFGSPLEAELVRALRGSGPPRLSLVAELREEVVGHVFFSPVSIEGSVGCPPSGGLAPLAVAPAMQRQGAGSALVRAGLEACVPLGWKAVFLLGSPAYYSRFGFVLAAPLGLRYENESFDSAFQVVELIPEALSGCTGWVRYHDAFAKV